MYAYIELSNIARTDSIIQSLSWMNYLPSNTNRSLEDHHEGWLATGNTNHIVSVTYTSNKSDENLIIPDRTNFNLRAHRTEVRLVAWNIPYQKLATVDEKGVIFVWVKHDNRWSLELINDRNHPVTAMSWSHDGRMTVICYEDGYILVGSVTGQRYWSTVLNLPQAQISAVTWLPDLAHVILGTTSGQLIVMDHHGNTTETYSLSTQSIRQLIYSCDKFYPNAADNNATKFVNDDYILACSLENGQILLLTNYQDQSPFTIDTNLQKTYMDWSCPGEILAIAGYKRLNDLTYTNQIIFYTRRGEFLHRIDIPQTAQPLSALCWAHGNDIVFVACGTFVYTVWIHHKPLPSMLTLCQMKIKEHLLKNSLENVDQLSIPIHLKQQLAYLYRSTIKGFLPDQNFLRSFVCNPLKSHLRLQCTMKRIDHEKDNQQSTTNNHLSGAVYVLYLEYLGGLIPLLTAKRISKICPDFIIFDPQMKSNHLLVRSSFGKLNSPGKKKNFSLLKPRSNTFQTISTVPPSNNNRSSLITNRNSIYVARTDVNNDHSRLITAKSPSACSSDEEEENDGMSDSPDNLSRRKTTTKGSTSKLCTIAANIWGTRFKFYGHSNHLPEFLGSVTYKTSLLHLQPRQMTVTVAGNNNIRKPKQTPMKRSKKSISPSQQQTKQSKRTKSINEITNSSTAPLTSPSSNVPQSLSSRNTSRRLRCTSFTIGTVLHRDTSPANSSSPSPLNLSRSTSPAASIANFVRPIFPPCIQVKEPLSPRFSRASSTIITHDRHCSPPMANNINASTASARNSLLTDNSPGYDNHNSLRTVSNVPENCFEPETYRNLYPLNSNEPKKLSLSDPTLNQTRRRSHHVQQKAIVTNSTTTDEYLSASSFHQSTTKEDEHIPNDNDEIENLSSYEETLAKEKTTSGESRRASRKYSSPRHRLMTCTSGVNDSVIRLTPSSDTESADNQDETSFYIMQNRPPLWNEQSQVYQLDFGGRVTLESAKNFQIEFKGKQVIQFGRIENNCYTLDFEWPFSPLQAFAVALANVTQRLK